MKKLPQQLQCLRNWCLNTYKFPSPARSSLTQPKFPQHQAQQKRCTLPENLRHLCRCLWLQHQLAAACNESKGLSRQAVALQRSERNRWESMRWEITMLPPLLGTSTTLTTNISTAAFPFKPRKNFACISRLGCCWGQWEMV